MTQHEETLFWSYYGYTQKRVIYCYECNELHESRNDKEIVS